MIECLVMKKYVWSSHVIQMISFLMYDSGQGMKRKGRVTYVVMWDYGKWQAEYICMFGREPAHCNAHIWVDLKVDLTTFQSTNISKMQMKN